mmetsp:Transcript_7165/g.16362  ORF Transcript_7165/g.16362 Transcript_7165/m.16362 type:complete len:166 (-) Transcript_7165:41-538(-)
MNFIFFILLREDGSIFQVVRFFVATFFQECPLLMSLMDWNLDSVDCLGCCNNGELVEFTSYQNGLNHTRDQWTGRCSWFRGDEEKNRKEEDHDRLTHMNEIFDPSFQKSHCLFVFLDYRLPMQPSTRNLLNYCHCRHYHMKFFHKYMVPPREILVKKEAIHHGKT